VKIQSYTVIYMHIHQYTNIYICIPLVYIHIHAYTYIYIHLFDVVSTLGGECTPYQTSRAGHIV
jgi:hypothetical protein